MSGYRKQFFSDLNKIKIMEFSAEMIASFLDGEIVGDKDITVNNLAKIEEGKKGDISFLSNPKYEHYIYTTLSSIVIVAKTFIPQKEVPATMIKVADPYKSFADLLNLYIANKPQPEGISEKCSVDPSVTMGEDIYVGDFTVIEKGVKIGNNCKIYPQVYIGTNVKIGDNVTLRSGVKIYEECVLGNNILIHSGTVIGTDGFGFAPMGDTYLKIPQIGNVVVEDNVEMGGNCSIDRATMGSTIIRKGVKIDNLVHIAHNVEIGQNTVLAAQFGIAGSSKVGANCMVAGQVGIVGHISIADRTVLASRAAVGGTIKEPGGTFLGFPAIDANLFKRIFIAQKTLPEMRHKVISMEKEIAQLKETIEKTR